MPLLSIKVKNFKIPWVWPYRAHSSLSFNHRFCPDSTGSKVKLSTRFLSQNSFRRLIFAKENFKECIVTSIRETPTLQMFISVFTKVRIRQTLFFEICRLKSQSIQFTQLFCSLGAAWAAGKKLGFLGSTTHKMWRANLSWASEQPMESAGNLKWRCWQLWQYNEEQQLAVVAGLAWNNALGVAMAILPILRLEIFSAIIRHT